MANKKIILIIFKLLHVISLLVALIAVGISMGLLAQNTTSVCLLFLNKEKLTHLSAGDANKVNAPCRLSLASAVIATVSLAVVAITELIKQVTDKIITFK